MNMLLCIPCEFLQHQIAFTEIHQSMGLVCSASSEEIKSTNSSNLKVGQNKAYCLPWEEKNKPVQSSRACCFCWCCLCSCLCKSRIIRGSKISAVDHKTSFTQINVEELLGGMQWPSTEQINEWADDFEALIRDEAGKRLFERFLKQEYSEENLQFWLEVERMKSEEKESERIRMAKGIYKRYIQPRADKEVNIEFKIKQTIEQKIDMPTTDIFDPAQAQVYFMMYRQSYPRFLSSKMYKTLSTSQMSRTLSTRQMNNVETEQPSAGQPLT